MGDLVGDLLDRGCLSEDVDESSDGPGAGAADTAPPDTRSPPPAPLPAPTLGPCMTAGLPAVADHRLAAVAASVVALTASPTIVDALRIAAATHPFATALLQEAAFVWGPPDLWLPLGHYATRAQRLRVFLSLSLNPI